MTSLERLVRLRADDPAPAHEERRGPWSRRRGPRASSEGASGAEVVALRRTAPSRRAPTRARRSAIESSLERAAEGERGARALLRTSPAQPSRDRGEGGGARALVERERALGDDDPERSAVRRAKPRDRLLGALAEWALVVGELDDRGRGGSARRASEGRRAARDGTRHACGAGPPPVSAAAAARSVGRTPDRTRARGGRMSSLCEARARSDEEDRDGCDVLHGRLSFGVSWRTRVVLNGSRVGLRVGGTPRVRFER